MFGVLILYPLSSSKSRFKLIISGITLRSHKLVLHAYTTLLIPSENRVDLHDIY